MIVTPFLLLLAVVFFILLLIAVVKGNTLKRAKTLYAAVITIAVCMLVLFCFNSNKIEQDIARFIRNTRPKDAKQVYTILFGKPIADSNLVILNFKDQIIPKIDCCIWMEVKVCPTELDRIIKRKSYHAITIAIAGSATYLRKFANRPVWWTPQSLGDKAMMLNVQFNERNQQTLFFGKDSSHFFICDEAL